MSIEGREQFDPHLAKKISSIRSLEELDGFVGGLRALYGGIPAEAMRAIERKRGDLMRAG